MEYASFLLSYWGMKIDTILTLSWLYQQQDYETEVALSKDKKNALWYLQRFIINILYIACLKKSLEFLTQCLLWTSNISSFQLHMQTTTIYVNI